MYMNGMGGHRGPMGGPRTRMGYVPHMGFRPMRVHRRPTGFFPLGAIFLLPALMFGGWIAMAVLAGILSVAGCVIGGIFEGLSSIAEGAFSGEGLVIGIVIGLIAFYAFRNRKARNEASGQIDGETTDTEIIEPTHYSRMGE